MITPDQNTQIDNYLKTSGYTPPTSPQAQGTDWYSQVKALQTPPPTPQPQSYGGFFESKPSGETPYQTGSAFTSPIVKYGSESNSPLATVAKAAVNLPTSTIRFAEGLLNPSTYTNIGQALAGGIQSIPGISQFYDKMSTAKGQENLQSNREAFHTFVDGLERQYGSWENIKRSIAEDPAGTALVVRGTMEGAAGISKLAGADELAGGIRNVAKNVVPIEKVAGLVSKTPKMVGGVVSKIGGETPTSAEVAGRITQAKPEQITTAQRALKGIDTAGVKTFKDLSGKFNETIKSNLATVDESFAKNPKAYSVNELTQKTPTGKFGLNYPKQAISDLKDLYTETKDIANKERITTLETKMKTEGLTAQEVNNLAKEYGGKYNAFKANNQIKAGKVAAGAENVRSGLKTTARSLLPDETAKTLDKQTSDMIQTKEMIDAMDKKVAMLKNKLVKPGLIQKVGGFAGRTIDVITGGFLKGLWKQFSGQGIPEGKILNPLELQDALSKNLKLLDKLNAMKPEDALTEISKSKIP
jgi:hypothetical protein